MRFHVLGLPHTITAPDYTACAFTQKVLGLCYMLRLEGHDVLHYGHEESELPPGVENVVCVLKGDLEASYPGHYYKTAGFPPNFSKNDPCYIAFRKNAIEQLGRNARKGDFLLCTFGGWQKEIADAFPDLITVESGIGYPTGTFARFKIFESYAIMHAYQTNNAALHASEAHWYDAVIPNSFFRDRFEYQARPTGKGKPYLLFLGRVNNGKGIHIATDIARTIEMPLIVAGAGYVQESEWVKPVGLASINLRKGLLANATATICASTFLEPFCGVQIESMLSGTPVISSDWGAFAEYNKHGVTGFRCKTFEQFLWAARNIGQIDRTDCAVHAAQFLHENIAPFYTEYFQSVKDVFGGKGWYEPRPDRTSLRYASF